MKLLKRFAAIFGTALLLTGCDRLDLVQWSPDGKRLAVVSGDGLRFSDDTGSLTKNIPLKLCIFRWLPDSQHALIVTAKESSNWNELKQLLSPTERSKTITVAESLWKYNGDLDKWKYRDDNNVLDSLVYLDYKYGARAVKATLLKKSKHNVLPDKPATATIYTAQVFNLSQDKAEAGPVLLRTQHELDDVRVSRNGKLAAVTQDNTRGGYLLEVVAIEGGATKVVSANASRYPDWSLDSKGLFYITPGVVENDSSKLKNDTGKRILLASLMRLDLTDANGKLLAKFGKSKDLAELPFSGSDRIRCLPDGSIILSSEQLKLPCTQKKFDQSKTLCKMSADLQALEPLTLTGDSLGDELDDFEINQDGTKAVVAGDHGQISIVELGNGKVTTLEPKGPTSLKFLPQFRNADDLCYPVRSHDKAAGGHDVELCLQSLPIGPVRILSKDWPAKSIRFLVDAKEADSKKNPKKQPPSSVPNKN